MVQTAENPEQFYAIPEDVPTVCKLIEKDAEDKFELVISEKRQMSPDTYFFRLAFPDP